VGAIVGLYLCMGSDVARKVGNLKWKRIKFKKNTLKCGIWWCDDLL
jgi:hypothetical protein